MQLGRNKRRHRRPAVELHARDVTTEKIVAPMINVVMGSMTGGAERSNFKFADANRTRVVGRMHFLLRDWPHFTPEPMHVCRQRFESRIPSIARDQSGDSRPADERESSRPASAKCQAAPA